MYADEQLKRARAEAAQAWEDAHAERRRLQRMNHDEIIRAGLAVNAGYQEKAEAWACIDHDLVAANDTVRQAERARDVIANQRTRLKTDLCKRVGPNLRQRLYNTAEGLVLVQYHSATLSTITRVVPEPKGR